MVVPPFGGRDTVSYLVGYGNLHIQDIELGGTFHRD